MTDEPETYEIPEDAERPLTKGDLDTFRREVVTAMANKDELQAMERRILHHFDAAVENIAEELKGANADEISGMKDTDQRFHERLVPLEQQAGIASPEPPYV